MAIRSIVTFPHPALKQRCAPVEAFDADLHQLLDDMAETMATAEGIGLAANQVAVAQRIFIMDVPVDRPEPARARRGEPRAAEEPARTGLLEVLNPRITASRGEVRYEEGCLSFPGVQEWVVRAAEIDLEFQDRHGQPQRLTARGLLAICIQHELDHLEGVVFLDRLSPLKRRIVLRDYLRTNAELIADQDSKERAKQRQASATR